MRKKLTVVLPAAAMFAYALQELQELHRMFTQQMKRRH